MTPSFVIDLPGGGGKRLVSTYENYDPKTGRSTWRAPGLPGWKGQRIYEYHDPYPRVMEEEELSDRKAALRKELLGESQRQRGASGLKHDST